jgi:hypothetical protein
VIYLVEFRDRVVVFFRWVWSYLTWNWGVRIIFQAKPLDNGPERKTDPPTGAPKLESKPEPDGKPEPRSEVDSEAPSAGEAAETEPARGYSAEGVAKP